MNKTILSLAVAGLLMSAGAASAQSVDTTFDVSATVSAACFIDSAAELAFAPYSPVSGDVVDGSTTVEVRCTNGHPYDIGLSLGANAIESVRRMAGPEDAFLDYELYSDSGRTTVWGNAGEAMVEGTGSGEAESHTIYGRIAADQIAATTGAYADIITITVAY